MAGIKLLMCCHKQYEIIPPMFEPILCGAEFHDASEWDIADNIGDNISHKNREYCELTAHYYAWKNETAEYYGFCHYRRFFCSPESTDMAYLTKGRLNDKASKRLLGSEEYWRSLIESYDIIVPRSEDMGLAAREHYVTSAFHYSEDLQLFLEIMDGKAPFLSDVAEEYLCQNRQYFCNMFIMDKKHFFEYCEILFDILDEFDNRKTRHGDFQADRTDGYLGEIFTGIYINHCRRSGAKIMEVPRLDVFCGLKKRMVYLLMPPESSRRFLAKKIVKKIKGKQNA
ncbi:MAG: DUF4422 domain-containing protein [Oscillospiraceae bacterium]|nr:DUF4422 domain-containing protein [Oscillospiraceae bacterium]